MYLLENGLVYIAIASDNTTQNIGETKVLSNIQIDEKEAMERAACFAEYRDRYFNDLNEKHISLYYMQSLQQEADSYRKMNLYFKSMDRYNMAAIYYPRVLLFFKYAEVSLRDILNNDKILSESLRNALKDYRLALAFYQYEPENDKSISLNCLEKMQREINCLQEIYLDYANSNSDDVVSKDNIMQCLQLSPDIFQYENYCK
jgi:hypothetical protein